MIRRKTGTATNSRFWNWLAVPGLPTVQFASLWPCASKPLHPLTPKMTPGDRPECPKARLLRRVDTRVCPRFA